MEPKIYLVGGAVRDLLLNRQSKDRDYVVVGATPEWMLDHGYKQVGSSFPVFLHPSTGEECALARTERKSGRGYYGFEVNFDPSTTLEQDLIRRDLTINAMAMDDTGHVIDPYGGQEDLKNGVLRHTSDAFAEDPLRVLRVIRFAARYGFDIHPDTVDLCRRMVQSDMLKDLARERIWTEMWKAFCEDHRSRILYWLMKFKCHVYEPLSLYMKFPSAFPLDITERREMKGNTRHGFVYSTMFFTLPTLMQIDDKRATELRVPLDIAKTGRRAWTVIHSMVAKIMSPEQTFEVMAKLKYDATWTSDEWSEWMLVFDVAMNYAAYFQSCGVLHQNMKLLSTARVAVREIDMTALTENVEKSKIKNVVHEAKRDAVLRAVQDPAF